MAKPVALPLDGEGNPVQITPPVVALEETYDTTISSSTEITLNTGATFIEVSAIDEGIFMKWGTADVTNSDFDEYIPKNSTRQFFIPESETAVNFLQRAATAILVMIEK